MTDPRLSQQLERVAIRIRRLRLWRGLAAVWLLAAGAGLLLAGVQNNAGWQLPHAAATVFAAALALATYLAWKAHASCRDHHAVAERLEAGFPELQSCLRTALEQRPTQAGCRFSFLQDRVIRQALNHAYRHNWPSLVPGRRIAAAMVASGAAFVLMLFVLAGLNATTESNRRLAASRSESATPIDDLIFTVEPGDTEVERGTSLLVLARFQGPQPTGATLVFESLSENPTVGRAAGPSDAKDVPAGRPTIALPQPNPGFRMGSASPAAEPIRLNMAKSLDDPMFGGRIATVDGPLDYHVEMAEKSSQSYHVTVFEYPKLLRADARLVYPDYTGSDERLIEDVRTVSAVEGAELTLLCHLNKPVASASLVEADRPPLVLEASPNDGRLRQVTLTCTKSRKLRLDLVDEQGRKNKTRTEITIKVLPNQPPDLKLAFPARDIEVSPLEEADIKATAWDDFGLRRFGLTYELAGGEPVEVVLGENAAAKKRHELAHVIKLEDLQAEPDQLLAYHFWAEDFAADGQLRRTQSDMYFAEVRPFDEVFRQGQQPPGGAQQQSGGANAEAAEKLLQLQKDIINATWKVIRREAAAASGKLRDDVESIRDSQTAAQEQAEQAKQKLTDAKSQAHAEEAIEAMRKAVEQLTASHDGNSAAPLRPALAAEQAAYQALLKLRAREHSVVRGQQQGGGGGGANRSQQQLQQLELKNDENRYETQRTAQSQPPEERETRQVLNRLSELARRQNDLNQRLKELRSALEEAQTEPEREEIRRQLKRLREEQEDVLRDTDELKSRMEQPENRERMADAREQLDETRENVRRAGEALADENVSRAAAAGTRAERDFQQLRNEFRRRAAGQFSDEMRQMRDDARKLEEDERQIAQALAGENERHDEKTLRGEDLSEKLPDELARQRQRLNELLDRMRETIDAAETPEPLLAEQLYETARKSQEQNIERALEAAEVSTRRGFTEDAREQEEPAGQGIHHLREGIERAAESVLGDETEALRRAREELNRLTDEVSGELERNMEQGAKESAAQSSAPEEEGSGFRVQGSGKTEPGPRADEAQRDEKGAASPEKAQGEDRDGSQGERGEKTPPREGSPSAGSPAGQGESNRGQSEGGQYPAGETGQRRGETGARGRAGARRLTGGANDASGSGGSDDLLDVGARGRAPIGGDDFRDWSDRLRDVEEMIDDPELRAQAARVRQRAKAIRTELKRHSHEPNWKLVQIDVARPLAELRDRVAEELLRRTSQDALTPLDRDPVPPKYQEKTRRYYERLGSGR